MVRFRIAVVLAALAAALLPAPPAAAAPVRAPDVAGGDLLAGSGRCTAAFNLSGRNILTGYCGPVGSAVYLGGVPVGTVSWTTAQQTAGVVHITNPAVGQLAGVRTPGGVAPITGAVRATIGRAVRKSSPVTGLRSGTVTGINQTVNHAGGIVTGLDRTTLCPSAGEAGAPIFADRSAVAVTLGGSGNCSTGGSTYGLPVVPILQGLGLSIY